MALCGLSARFRGLLLAAWVVAVTAAPGRAPAGGSAWPQFRGPTGLGYTDEKDLPVKWGGKDNTHVLWKVTLPEAHNPFSSPIVTGGRLILTVATARPRTHRVLCYRAADGAKLWETPVEPGPWVLKDLRGGYGAPTPCTDGQRVYAAFGSAVIAGLDLDGKLLWRRPFTSYAFDIAMGSSPVVYKDTVLFVADQMRRASTITAYDGKTGRTRWVAKRPFVSYAQTTPVIAKVDGQDQMLLSCSNSIQGVDPTHGTLLWYCRAWGQVASCAYGKGIVYCDDGRREGAGVAVEAGGKGNVTSTRVQWTYPAARGELSSPIIVGEYLYRLQRSRLLCIELATGKQVYRRPLPGVAPGPSPVAAPEGRLYFAAGRTSYVIRTGPTCKVLAVNVLPGQNNHASPAVAGGRLYIRGMKTLFCIGTTTAPTTKPSP